MLVETLKEFVNYPPEDRDLSNLLIFYQYPMWFISLHTIQTCGLLLNYISQWVHMLWLVNWAVCILLYGPLKFKAAFVAKIFCVLLPSVLNFWASTSLKLSFNVVKKVTVFLFIVVEYKNNQVFSFVSQCGHLWCRWWCFNCILIVFIKRSRNTTTGESYDSGLLREQHTKTARIKMHQSQLLKTN